MINEIIDSFKGLTPILWVSEILGMIGFIIILVSYQFNKKTFLIISGTSYLFFGSGQILAGLYANLITSSMAIVRNCMLLYFLIRYHKEAPKSVLFIYLTLVWIIILTYMGFTHTFAKWDNYLPPALVTIYVICANNKNYYVLKAGALTLELGYFIYYMVYNLPFSMLRQLILAASIIVSVIRMIISTNKENKASTNAS